MVDKNLQLDITLPEGTPRLEIKSVRGYPVIFFTFHFTLNELDGNDGAYHVLKTILYNDLYRHYQRKNKAKDPEYRFDYKVTVTDTVVPGCFCISADDGWNTEEQSMAIVSHMINYAVDFDLAHSTFENEKTKQLYEEHLASAKVLANILKTEVLEEKNYEFTTEYWSPFD